MINSTMKFNIKGETIEFPTYKKGDNNIVSFTRLRKFYLNNKEKYNLNNSIKFCDSKITQDGLVAHAFVCITLTGPNYTNDFVGEVTSAEYRDDVDKKNPISLAYNKALSAALLNYFGFPEKTYTTAQFLETEKKEEKDTGEINPPAIGEDEAIPFNVNPGAVTFPDPVKGTEPSKDTSDINKKETHVPEETKEAAKEEPSSEKNNEETGITMDTNVGFGKYASLTIAELMNKKDEGDDFAVKFVGMIKEGKITQPTEKGKAVIEFIKKK